MTPSILPLELKGVSFEVNGMRYIKEVDYILEAGSNTIILGPNGAGKSLFLRLCHGLIPPTNGSIKWGGSSSQKPENYQAMVFQKPVMLKRSVIENLHFGLKCRGIPKINRQR